MFLSLDKLLDKFNTEVGLFKRVDNLNQKTEKQLSFLFGGEINERNKTERERVGRE